MPPKIINPAVVRKAAISAAKGASWMSLLAATTLGITEVNQLKARVVSDRDVRADAQGLRLVVQSYARTSLAVGDIPSAYARPRASAQRAITAEELREGVEVSIVHLDAAEFEGVVVAWIEPGAPDLEFDGLRARPPKNAYYGVALRNPVTRAEVVLRQRDA